MSVANDQRHVIAMEVEDKPGVLTRISSLFSRRGFNVESLTVGHTHKPGISRFTVVVLGEEKELEQIRKQSQKLIHVLKTCHVVDKDTLTEFELEQIGMKVKHGVMRELAIVKVHYDEQSSRPINHIVERFSARMLHWSGYDLLLEFSGTEEKIDAVFEELENVTVLESVRSGKIAMSVEPIKAV